MKPILLMRAVCCAPAASGHATAPPAADKAKGAVKDTVGKMTGDTKMQAEGKMDKAKGTARNIAGDVKDGARDATDND